jgi:hypothetical protein
MRRRPVLPPYPELIRRPAARFGWLEDRLLHEDWLARLGPEGISVMVLLALAADRHGASFYSRERMADKLGISRQDVDQALNRMLELRLVAHRPWRQGNPDGIWQLLPLPQSTGQTRGGQAVSIGDLCRSLGFQPPDQPTQPSKPPDSRAS